MIPPLSAQLETTFQTGSALGSHSKFLKAGLKISVGSFQKTANVTIITLVNGGISLHFTVSAASISCSQGSECSLGVCKDDEGTSKC